MCFLTVIVDFKTISTVRSNAHTERKPRINASTPTFSALKPRGGADPETSAFTRCAERFLSVGGWSLTLSARETRADFDCDKNEVRRSQDWVVMQCIWDVCAGDETPKKKYLRYSSYPHHPRGEGDLDISYEADDMKQSFQHRWKPCSGQMPILSR